MGSTTEITPEAEELKINNTEEINSTDIILSIIGWNPILKNSAVKEKERELNCGNLWKFILFAFLALLDITDTVFDFILSYRVTFIESDEHTAYGILLLIMTFVCRLLSVSYMASQKSQMNKTGSFAVLLFCLVELTIFLLEDGASIMLMANDPKERDFVTYMSMYMSAICGICYCSSFVILSTYLWVTKKYEWNDPHPVSIIAVITMPLCAAFQVFILFQYVVLNHESKDLSAGLEIAVYMVYGVGSFISISCSYWFLWFHSTDLILDCDGSECTLIKKWALKKREIIKSG